MRKIIIALVLIVATWNTSLAQEPTNETIILENATGRFLRVTPDGVTVFAELPALEEFSAISSATLSPDGTLFIFSGFRVGEAGIYVGNLTDNTCCQKWADPIPAGSDFVLLGDLSPDGKEISAVFSKVNVGTDRSITPTGFVVTYGLDRGRISNYVSTTIFANQTIGAYLGDWTDNGIEVFATCMACNRPTEGIFSLWHTEDNTVTRTFRLFQGQGRRLIATDEIVLPVRNEAYATGEGFLGNVINYYPSTAPDQVPYVIYHNPEHLLISSVSWIQNGNSLLISHLGSDVSVILGRDGSRVELEIPADNQFLAATSEGWLAHSETELFHYILADGEVNSTVLTNVEGILVPLSGVDLIPTDTTVFAEQAP